jgi:pSer/pThr/pTyr-binding forkhead associated (FHA) protein
MTDASRRNWVLASAALPRGFSVLGPSPLVIGRGHDCQLVLYSQSVSRRHARISRELGSYVIEDLGSQNGTQVNGRDVGRQQKILEHEDVITIGVVQLQLLILDGFREEVAVRFSPGLEETDQVVRTASSTALFSGALTREVLHQVCQLIEVHSHSGFLRVVSGGCAGYLRFTEGTIVEARFGSAKAENAARTILGLAEGEYAFHARKPGQIWPMLESATLKLKAVALVVEAVQREERRRGGDDFLDELPSGDTKERTRRLTRPRPPSSGQVRLPPPTAR